LDILGGFSPYKVGNFNAVLIDLKCSIHLSSALFKRGIKIRTGLLEWKNRETTLKKKKELKTFFP